MINWIANVGLALWRIEADGRSNMTIANLPAIRACRPAWNKGRIVGQKRPLVPKHVWAIRVRLEIAKNHRNLALFNLAIASKLRGCDRVRLKVADIYASGQVKWPPGANPRLHELRLVFCLHHVTTGPRTKPLPRQWRPWQAFRTDRHPVHLGMWAAA